MEELKRPVEQVIRYADGSETVIKYNELGEKDSEVVGVPTTETVPEKVIETESVIAE